MTRYRNRLQIIAEILEIAKDGAKKTHIMYKANLSYQLLCKYLDEIVECGLIFFDCENSYVVAPKGKRFLQRFNKYKKHRERIKKQLEVVDKEKKALIAQMHTNLETSNSHKTRLVRKGMDGK